MWTTEEEFLRLETLWLSLVVLCFWHKSQGFICSIVSLNRTIWQRQKARSFLFCHWRCILRFRWVCYIFFCRRLWQTIKPGRFYRRSIYRVWSALRSFLRSTCSRQRRLSEFSTVLSWNRTQTQQSHLTKWTNSLWQTLTTNVNRFR